MKTFKLLNKITEAPVDSSLYKNKVKFNISLLAYIDTSVIYEEFNTEKKILARLDVHNSQTYYNVCKFYSNGYFNFFVFNREKTPLLEKEFDPLFDGYRGVYFAENNLLKYNLFVAINQRYNIGKTTGSLRTNGDTLFIKLEFMQGSGKIKSDEEVYIKRRLPPSFFVFKADW